MHALLRGRAGAAALAWTPADILGDLSFWWEADEVEHTGGLVTRAVDKTGNGNHFDASTTARPTLGTGGAGGQPYLDFDGANNFMDLVAGKSAGDIITASAWTLWAVFAADAVTTNSATTQYNEALIAHATGYWGLMLKSAPTVGAYFYGGGVGPSPGDHYVPQGIALGTPHAVLATFDGSTLATRLDGGAAATAACNATNGNMATGVQIGRAGTAAAFFNGRISGMLGAPTELITANADLLQAYAAAKFGVAA